MTSINRFKRKEQTSGSHVGVWFISFADLMSLLMAFMVMLLSFSIQDQDKLTVAATSMQSALGIEPSTRLTGVFDRNGSLLLDYPGQIVFPAVKAGKTTDAMAAERALTDRARQFALAAASLKLAWRDEPDITSISDHITVEDTDQGLDIVIADRDGRAMFPAGSKYPLEATRKALAAMAPSLQKLSNRIRVAGYTVAGQGAGDGRYGPWELSFDRADVTRQILEEFGLSADHFESVVGRGDSDPIFPDNPTLASNERVSITLLYEKPPVPVDLGP